MLPQEDLLAQMNHASTNLLAAQETRNAIDPALLSSKGQQEQGEKAGRPEHDRLYQRMVDKGHIVASKFPFVQWICPCFTDSAVEERFFWQKHKGTVLHLHRLQVIYAVMVLGGLLMPFDGPTMVWTFFRLNDLLSLVACVLGIRVIDGGDASIWASYDDVLLIWGTHYLGLNSLTVKQVANLLGCEARETHEECYQLLGCLFGLVAFRAFAKPDMLRLVVLMHVCLVMWVAAAWVLGTSLTVVAAVKMGIVYYAICVLCFMNARASDLESRRKFLLAEDRESDRLRQSALGEGFRRMLAMNYDCLTKLKLCEGLLLIPPGCKQMNTFCGMPVGGMPLVVCGATLSERERLTQFSQQLWLQIEQSPATLVQSPPLRAEFVGSSCSSSQQGKTREVELQALWVPSSIAQPSSDFTDKASSLAGVLWLGLRAVSASADPVSAPPAPEPANLPRQQIEPLTPTALKKLPGTTEKKRRSGDKRSSVSFADKVVDEVEPSDSASQVTCMSRSSDLSSALRRRMRAQNPRSTLKPERLTGILFLPNLEKLLSKAGTTKPE